MEAKIYDNKGKEKGTLTLSASVFGFPWNAELVRQVFLSERANARKVLAHTKDRSEVSGGGKKPWQQKGTGRARHGSSRSPIWVGGGISHGPRKDQKCSGNSWQYAVGKFQRFSHFAEKRCANLEGASQFKKRFHQGSEKFECLRFAFKQIFNNSERRKQGFRRDFFEVIYVKINQPDNKRKS